MKVAVVGAGAAGLAAAGKLRHGGLLAEVWEARHRAGGRIYTDTSWGFALELGATYLHGRDSNPLVSADLPLVPIDPLSRAIFDSRGRWLRHPERLAQGSQQLIERARALAWEAEADLSLAEAAGLAMTRPGPGRPGAPPPVADADSISGRGDPSAALSLGPDLLCPYPALLDRWLEGLTVHYDRPVTRVEWGEHEVRLDGHSFDRAILTLPLGVLRSFRFEPALPPAWQAAIASLGWTVLNKVALYFEQPGWPIEPDYLGPLNRPEGSLPLFFNGLKAWGKPVLVGYTSGRQALAWEAQPDSTLLAEAMAVLGPLQLGPLKDTRITRWGQDPWTRGGYSVLAPGADPGAYDVLAQPLGALRLAGEATYRAHPATVHGAYLSGLREAERILQGM